MTETTERSLTGLAEHTSQILGKGKAKYIAKVMEIMTEMAEPTGMVELIETLLETAELKEMAEQTGTAEVTLTEIAEEAGMHTKIRIQGQEGLWSTQTASKLSCWRLLPVR